MEILKQNLENNLGIDSSDIGTNLPTGIVSLDGLYFYIHEDTKLIYVDKSEAKRS